jgi:hypothetical protein
VPVVPVVVVVVGVGVTVILIIPVVVVVVVVSGSIPSPECCEWLGVKVLCPVTDFPTQRD